MEETIKVGKICIFASCRVEKEILSTIKYFSLFSYPPTWEEIYSFLKKKTSKRRLASVLATMVKKSLVVSFYDKPVDRKARSRVSHSGGPAPPSTRGAHVPNRSKQAFSLSFFDRNQSNKSDERVRYTLGEYSILSKSQFPDLKSQIPARQIISSQQREVISLRKIKKIDHYINLLSKFPQIKLIGLSGSVAMQNANDNDDVDLFIITQKERLWTARLISLILAQLMGLRRSRDTKHSTKDKVCLNLLMDESDLSVPKFKKTEYVAHEILQMKPLVIKDGIYGRFLSRNSWIYGIFPNTRTNFQFPISNFQSIPNSKSQISNLIGDLIEKLFKLLQLSIIKLHQTREIVTDTQLWFHPQDFGDNFK